MRLVDSHAHLQADAFSGDALDVLSAARLAGVERVLAPGWDIRSSRASIELAGLAGVDASAGIHPHEAGRTDEDGWTEVVELSRDPSVVAIGETGLDYDRGFSPRDVQLANLVRHLALAIERGKPVILHCRSRPGERDAQDDLSAALADHPGVRPVLHSFSGPVDYAERVLSMGGLISFSGLVFRAGEETSAEVARSAPADRLLVETDSPYLSPPGAPRRRNEPRWVDVTGRWVAERRGDPVEHLGDLLVANYDRTFSRR